MEHSTSPHPTQADLVWFLSQARPRRLRSMRDFAEQEIVIPDGPFSGRRFRCARQPYTACGSTPSTRAAGLGAWPPGPRSQARPFPVS